MISKDSVESVEKIAQALAGLIVIVAMVVGLVLFVGGVVLGAAEYVSLLFAGAFGPGEVAVHGLILFVVALLSVGGLVRLMDASEQEEDNR